MPYERDAAALKEIVKAHLGDYSGRRLVLVASDWVSPPWRECFLKIETQNKLCLSGQVHSSEMPYILYSRPLGIIQENP